MLGPEPNDSKDSAPATRGERLRAAGHAGEPAGADAPAIRDDLNRMPTVTQAPEEPSTWTLMKTKAQKMPLALGSTVKVPDRALVLRRGGPVDIYKVDGRIVEAQDGHYVSETDGRFWLPKGLKPGWIRIYTDNNPAPVTYREPLGYFAEDLGALGYTVPHMVGAGFEAPKKGFEFPSWLQYALIAVAVLGAGGLWLYNRVYG